MKIAVAVVVGVALLGAVGVVHAYDSKSTRSELCLDDCNFAFDKCQVREGSKGAKAGRCNIEVVRCKNACPQAAPEDTTVPTIKSHAKCIDRCRADYMACQAQPVNKRGGNCAAEDMRCEKACPAPPPPPETAPVEAAVEPDSPAGTAPVPAPRAVPVVEPKKPKRAARVEGAAAPAPASATPAAAVVEPAPQVRREAGTPPAAEPAAAAPATAATRPSQEKRGFFATLGCFFVSCEPEGSTPCLKQCATAYDECHAHESKRGGECNTRLMHCRQGCGNAPDAAR
jgi:hypothetical protein